MLVTGCANNIIKNSKSELYGILNSKGFSVKETDSSILIYLPEISFAFDSYVLNERAYDRLFIISEVLYNPEMVSSSINVEGHTDSRGSDKYNEKLSLLRARTVAEALISSGVNIDRITIRGFSNKHPLVSDETQEGGDNPEGRAQNRRVEIAVVFAEESAPP